MTNYREILRLHSLGLNKTEIASSCRCARNTVAATLQHAANFGLQWPLSEEMSDKQLSERLFPTSPSKPVYKMPDYAYVHKELQRSGVTLNLLWLEYCDQCRAAGEIPYQSTQFSKYYADYLAKVNATMHLNHKPGEVMQVDWAGDTAAVIDTDTGEIIPAYVFVATLPYSGYSYSNFILPETGKPCLLFCLLQFAQFIIPYPNEMPYYTRGGLTLTSWRGMGLACGLYV